VTNPVELAVAVFSRHLGRHRVIGVGAYSDTLRFRREIATDLGVRRQLVQGFVVGEHGEGMVPLWSSVKVHGMTPEELREIRRRLQQGLSVRDFPDAVLREKQSVMAIIKTGDIAQAYRYVDGLSSDLRVVIKPFVTQLSGAKTIAATANVTVDLVHSLLQGKEMVVSGQVQLAGEFYDIQTPLGVPILVTPSGWSRVVTLQLWAEEAEMLQKSAETISRRLKEDLAQHG